MKSALLCLLLTIAHGLHVLHAAEYGSERLVIGAEGRKGVAIVDPSNNNAALWHFPIAQVHDLHLLGGDGDGPFTILTQNGFHLIIEVDLNGKIVWDYDAKKLNREDGIKRIEIHGLQRLENGHTMIAESGSSRILEVGPDGGIVKKFPLSVKKSNAHSDTRIVRKLENGHYLVAHEAEQRVAEYDNDGKVVWDYPVPLFGREPARGHGPEAWGGKVFAAHRLDNGNTLVATGNGHSVIEVTPEKEVVWHLKQNDIEGVTLAWVTNLSVLDNGNFIIGNCHAGPDNPQIIEVTREKEMVWSFKDFNTFGNALANTLVIEGERAFELRAALDAIDGSPEAPDPAIKP